MSNEIKCDCVEFEFICEPDETGVIFSHKGKGCEIMEFCPIEHLQAFKEKYPNTKVTQLNNANDNKEFFINQNDIWAELLKEFPSICTYAPLFDPERHNHIVKKLSDKYSISKK